MAEAPAKIAADDFENVDVEEEVSLATSKTSLRSSVLHYVEENGRRYHALSAGKYFLPNDELELERLDLEHNLFLLTLDNKLCLCPKSEGAKRVLDIGTGTGIWAIDYADRYPEAEVIGVDLSPVAPVWVPDNCTFEVDDVEKEWVWSKPFDFIFSRMLGGSFAATQAFINKAYNHLEPGGYLEMIDMALPVSSDDGTLTEDHFLHKMSVMTVEAAKNLGRPIHLAPEYKEMFEKAGFEDVTLKRFKWPSNIWPKDPKFKEMGRWNIANIDPGLEGLTLFLFTHGLGMSKEETLAYCAGARKEIRDVKIHAYWPLVICYGKKPESATKAT